LVSYNEGRTNYISNSIFYSEGRTYITLARSEVFMAVKIQFFFWVVMPCGVTVGYQHFREPSCLHLQGEHRQQHPLKC